MQTLVNGQRNVFADMEHHVRRNSELPPLRAASGFHDYLAHASGVIHVGAHTGQERDIYGELPVVWIEAVPMICDILKERIADKPKQTALNYLVADGRCYMFGLASNACHSSSIFDLQGHKAMWPDVGYIASEPMHSVTLAQVIKEHDLRGDVYDALVLDVQGAELLVLHNAGDYLDQFQWIQAEAADFDAYEGGCTLQQLDAFLLPKGFIREQAVPCISRPGVGTYYETLYHRKDVESRGIDYDEKYADVRLNIGGGQTKMPGFVTVDRKNGQEAYPLAYPDNSVEEIVASHILEHFSHREIRPVLTEWMRVLKPGGKIRLAVPDFEDVVNRYQRGESVNVQGYVMGGHTDADDHHGCIFDRESLTEEMISVGLERIGAWDTAAMGCAAGPYSLNLMGFKPHGPVEKLTNIVRAVMSVPRFGPLMHPRCSERAFFQLGIEARSTSSCYWAQQISNCMEDAIAHPDCEFVLTMDFDTVFSAADVLELYHLMRARPDVDAVIPIQSKRASTDILFSIPGKTPGTVRPFISEADLSQNLLPANTGHFGLTLFRADSLRRFPRPWMVPEPSASGVWRDGHTDADIDFWKRFRAAGFNACLAPKVVVGHLEEVVSWPGKDLVKIYQSTTDYDESGIPKEVVR